MSMVPDDPGSNRALPIPRRSLVGMLLVALAAAVWTWPAIAAEAASAVPAAVVDEPLQPGAAPETAVLAGGCFWGVQAVFQHVKGVRQAVSGYSGGTTENPDYQAVSSGDTGHAESVEVTFDPGIISYGTILRIYFSVAHNPTELNRQGPDVGTQYRSAIFARDAMQRRVAEAYIAQLDKARLFPKPIVTEVRDLAGFHPAESYHQNYATLHPDNPYIAYNDLPKLATLQRLFPDLYRSTPVLVSAIRPQG
ncbi:MAG: peptide-methionine (S)-S-oxide reductase MsrA [Stellaceae bacterium]